MAKAQNGNTKNNKSKTRIMLVDDEIDIISVLRMVLEQNGYQVDVFEDPTFALKNYKTGMYDLLILDIKMPEIDGFELYDEIKKIDNKVKVCFLTG